MIRRVLSASAALALLGLLPAAAQMPPQKNVATVTARTSPASIARGGRGVLLLTVSVAPHFHINANKPNDPSLIPTSFTGLAPAGIKFGTPKYPAAKTITVSYSKQPMLVYQGKSVIAVPFTVSKTAKPGKAALGGTLGYQGCNERSCYPPNSASVHGVVAIK